MTWTTRPRSEVGGLAAIDAGEGPLVVLLHGVGLRAEAWGAQIDALVAAGFRVLCPDMPGHGASAFHPVEGLESYAAPVAALIDQPAVLIGHSMGALIATRIAAEGGTVMGVAALNAIFQRSDEARNAVLARAHALDAERANNPSTTLQRWFDDRASPERDACDSWLRKVDPRAYKAAYTVFAESNGPTAEQLAAIPCPALFLTGEDEPNSTPRMSQDMAALAPNGRAGIIPNAAHMMPMTHAQQVNATLVSFVKECLK
ncbi:MULTISPECIES: alpha/beta hydrolase [unclassified Ruegeria]|uniref:alpha/beta fold hydrolase n=1 Tax=unclassified Ruegeria TaxID=2625375 RepID=UPI001ADC08FF|nr:MULTISPECIES: alpha/beta hydrolase [unclassified Ruegeria]MBO9412697.1 alpha/beta hydrolase [Ruegeria sp. R8_1]MBO9416755.1 alpha/beta hydrolase [Ruegeria sp. R8_2]